MRDIESPTLGRRQDLLGIALEQDGAHYVWGGTGETPGVCHVRVWSHEGRVRMHLPVFDRRHPILHAAWTQVRGDKICAGRAGLYNPTSGAPYARLAVHPVPTNITELESIQNPDQFLWPRPYENPGGPMRFGEACEGKRHFDCVGFVNWCISTSLGHPVSHSIEQWERSSIEVWPTPDARIHAMGPGAEQVWAGDIEISRADGHIALCTGDTVEPRQSMVHAQDTLHGVLTSPCHIGPNVQGYRFIRRLPWFVPNAGRP